MWLNRELTVLNTINRIFFDLVMYFLFFFAANQNMTKLKIDCQFILNLCFQVRRTQLALHSLWAASKSHEKAKGKVSGNAEKESEASLTKQRTITRLRMHMILVNLLYIYYASIMYLYIVHYVFISCILCIYY